MTPSALSDLTARSAAAFSLFALMVTENRLVARDNRSPQASRHDLFAEQAMDNNRLEVIFQLDSCLMASLDGSGFAASPALKVKRIAGRDTCAC